MNERTEGAPSALGATRAKMRRAVEKNIFAAMEKSERKFRFVGRSRTEVFVSNAAYLYTPLAHSNLGN